MCSVLFYTEYCNWRMKCVMWSRVAYWDTWTTSKSSIIYWPNCARRKEKIKTLCHSVIDTVGLGQTDFFNCKVVRTSNESWPMTLNYTFKTGFTKVLVIYKFNKRRVLVLICSSDFNRWASLASNKANWSGRWKGKCSKKRQKFLQWWNIFAFEAREHNP